MLREADELFALCGAAAAQLGIPDPAFVEKDFWVVELLRSIVRPIDLAPVGDVPCSAAVRFKGGTSLSKAFGFIKRFSEDVDILVECEGYGAGAREKRLLRPLCERAGLFPAAWLLRSSGCSSGDGNSRWHLAGDSAPDDHVLHRRLPRRGQNRCRLPGTQAGSSRRDSPGPDAGREARAAPSRRRAGHEGWRPTLTLKAPSSAGVTLPAPLMATRPARSSIQPVLSATSLLRGTRRR